MKTAAAREAPTGLIDPWLRTVTFSTMATRRSRAALLRLRIRRVIYGDGPRHVRHGRGLRPRAAGARRMACRKIYFNGCAGDVTAGKYNTPARRRTAWRSSQRLVRRNERRRRATRRVPLTDIELDNDRCDCSRRARSRNSMKRRCARRSGTRSCASAFRGSQRRADCSRGTSGCLRKRRRC